MAYLVKPVEQTNLSECYRLIQEAHGYLVSQATKTITHVAQHPGNALWGCGMKRVSVALEDGKRPELIEASEHNLLEIINQCATLERLLAALLWAQEAKSGLRDYTVQHCHPTTSGTRFANDLVLVRALDETGEIVETACFEVSDSVGNGNAKIKKDLQSLGVVPPIAQKGIHVGYRQPTTRRFLVVAAPLARQFIVPGKQWFHEHYTYHLVNETSYAVLMEQVPPLTAIVELVENR